MSIAPSVKELRSIPNSHAFRQHPPPELEHSQGHQAAFAAALDRWRVCLGDAYVITRSEQLTQTATATFQTTQQIPAILQPANRAEVQACLRIANDHRIPIYPISRGKNWGYGSRVPVRDGCVLMAMTRMDQIVHLDEELGTLTVEPGVTFAQAFAYLREHAPHYMLSTTPSHPEASLIGNLMERGLGLGPYANRIDHACDFEIVLPNGDCIHSGFGRFEPAAAVRLHRHGVGPSFDTLFTQSNLGIVTRATLWLHPQPADFQPFRFSFEDGTKLSSVIDTMRQLKHHLNCDFRFFNDYRQLTAVATYPWEEAEGHTPLPAAQLLRLKQKHRLKSWFCDGAIFAPDRHSGRHAARFIRKTLHNQVDSILVTNQRTIAFARRLHGKFGLDFADLLNDFDPDHSRWLGAPVHHGEGAYWRMRKRPTFPIDLDQAGVGAIWQPPIIPFQGEAVTRAVEITYDVMLRHQFEPSIALHCTTPRAITMVVPIFYDRTMPGEDEQALRCHNEFVDRMNAAGFLPYRMGLAAMDRLPASHDETDDFLRTLKQTLDPNGILAPGRYS